MDTPSRPHLRPLHSPQPPPPGVTWACWTWELSAVALPVGGLTVGSGAAGRALPRCRGFGRNRRRCRPPRRARRAGSAGTPGPRSRRCCTPTPLARAPGSCSGLGPRTRTVKGTIGQGEVNGGIAAGSHLQGRGGRPAQVCRGSQHTPLPTCARTAHATCITHQMHTRL